jgi:hypothetical protein
MPSSKEKSAYQRLLDKSLEMKKHLLTAEDIGDGGPSDERFNINPYELLSDLGYGDEATAKNEAAKASAYNGKIGKGNLDFTNLPEVPVNLELFGNKNR